MTDDSADAAKEEAKRKMREALEKKKGREHAAHGDGVGKGGKHLHGVDRPVGPRQFRRKSG